MNEEIDIILDSTKEDMEKAISHLKKQLQNIRAGKANPTMLSTVMVEYYGTMTPLNQVSNINTPDARTLSIQPFEKSLIQEIEKGIMNANLGFNPMNNGDNVIINVPPLTEERRTQLSKQAKAEAEEAKIAVRNDRRNALHELKDIDLSEDQKKDIEDEIQKITDSHIEKIDQIFEAKEKEIMTV
ncbi:ribosome recycling factor [Mesohalobacter halotolerans]|jgi:ribosome recycling factor|uniref:Ribosome-recycling factor n=1 Tax=Mesohalobacter halotolerans TaxID=1883405 RepID=A0A4U5TRH4_9FLAO|nr:ribosome recycling factor [Mesohalobacter halotolerans]MBS3738434.1 ribosome recycling factor [Psychroflexus sp.]NBC58976.1 ribosome recycling factor [Bacteroidota bacterium]TKS56860.1 ribosome recycling factor [Mesohalobacter halotolerans]